MSEARLVEGEPLQPKPKIIPVDPSITEKQIKRRVVSSLLRRIKGKLLERFCSMGYPNRPPPEGLPLSTAAKFVSYNTACAGSVKDGDVLCFVGIAGNLTVTGFWFALARRFKATGSPKNLTVVSHGGNGGRGKLPGSLDDVLALKGCVTKFVTAHCDTHIFAKRRMLDPSDALEIHIVPLGVMSLIYASMADGGPPEISVTTGVGTVYDPRTGRGTPLTPGVTTQYVKADDDKLTFSLPPLTCAALNAAAADNLGNIYKRGMAMVSDGVEVARAVKRNGGRVIVTVGLLVPVGYGEVLLKAEEVDAIVVDPTMEQMFGATYAEPFPFITLTAEQDGWDPANGARVCGVINKMLKLTPVRAPVDELLGRLGAHLFCQHTKPGARLNIGTGLPEEVGKATMGIRQHIEPFNEGGSLGGISAPGAFFGASICPKEIVSSAEVYRRVYKHTGGHLDCVCVGGLEVDASGSVNVAARRDPMGYVGPGGFVDLTNAADVCIFAVSFATGASIDIANGKVSVKVPGRCKFLEKVQEVHFSGPAALAAGKKVFYVTHLGAFQLTAEGLKLVYVFPGVDITAHIIEATQIKIVLPGGGAADVPIVPLDVVSGGEGYVKLLEKELRI